MRRRAASVIKGGTRLPRRWFSRDTISVARDLIGCALTVEGEVVARIVESEAYLGLADPASHAFRGPTPRAAIMFGLAGHLYVYRSYGVHHCANIVTERDGVAGAVLLRGAVVETGEDMVRHRRGAHVSTSSLLRGPGNLCRGLGVTLQDNGVDLCAASARLHVLDRSAEPPVIVGRRVGITAGADEPLRFAWEGHPAVSAPVPWRTGARADRQTTQTKEGPAERAL
ncbi:MAG: DNA-3-methyladenine glycosylase [Candidatus Dormibacteraeota bacterium]|nr:DNA-3-methyladenine glycosylase [Candidatus Dormibacteraeota bacterium]